MRIIFCVSALVAAVAVAGVKVKAAQAGEKAPVQPAVYSGTADGSAIQNVYWRRYAYRPNYGGYAYPRAYSYNVYRPYYNGGYYQQPYYSNYFYGGYYPPYYGGYNYGPGVRYSWRRGAYYW